MNNPRNLFIVGFALFMCLSVSGPSGYFQTYKSTNGGASPIDTGDTDLDAILDAIFSTPMIITFLCGFILDNTVAGSKEDRGLLMWERQVLVHHGCRASELA